MKDFIEVEETDEPDDDLFEHHRIVADPG